MVGSPPGDDDWHRPRFAGVTPIGVAHIKASCGRMWTEPEGRQAAYASNLCARCWPPFEVPQTRKLLGHHIETKRIEVDPRGISIIGPLSGDSAVDRPIEWRMPFVLSVLDVADGVRTTYRGLMTATTPRKIAGTAEPFADVAQYATGVRFSSVSVDAIGRSDLLPERGRRATERAILNLATKILMTGPSQAIPSVSEVAGALDRPSPALSAKDRHDAVLRRVGLLSDRFSGDPNCMDKIRFDSELRSLSARDVPYSTGYVRQLKSTAAQRGYCAPLTPRGRGGGRRT